MRNRSVTTVLDAPREDAFAFLSRIENLPRWATEFARELRWEDGRAKVVNGRGELWFDMAADERTGVIDMYAGPEPDDLALFPAPVIALPGGRSAFTFTMFQGQGMPDEVFDEQYESLLRELENVQRELARA
jgi:hypothetical protein